jgi:hypothetical protein
MTYTILTRGNVHSSGRGSIGPRVLTLEWPQAAPATSTTQRRAVASGSCHIPVVANLKEREVAIWEASGAVQAITPGKRRSRIVAYGF